MKCGPKDQHYRSLRVSRHTIPRSVFSYYGGKSKISSIYPCPEHPLIIEPFGGAAAYAWRHRHNRTVWINDADPITVSIWRFLQSKNALEQIEYLQKSNPSVKDKRISQLGIEDEGLKALIEAELGRGFQGRHAVQDKITAWGSFYYWPRLALKFKQIIPAIRDWKITLGDYTKIKSNGAATWFVDPPYSNEAGRRYRHNTINYKQLAKWCRSRTGQIIVCEHAAATWLPFVSVSKGLGMAQNNPLAPREAMWTNGIMQYELL